MEPSLQNPPPSSPPPPEPAQKKLKLSPSITTNELPNVDNSTTTESATKPPHFKRRKLAIFFAYCGVGYQGMQKNPGAKTIEADLEKALILSGAVPEIDRENPNRWDWARSARTDKGVSALGQVVSGRFIADPPGLVDRLHSHLPDQIRIFGYKRATPSFNAKKLCDRRRYVYMLPVFALDPTYHRDDTCKFCEAGLGEGGSDLLLKTYGEAEKARLSGILKRYEGTHNFHNFTTRTKADDPSAKRYIVSFRAETSVSIDGIEFVKCEVVGQSFMLHQIRKMIGLSVAIMRGCADDSIFETAFQQDVRINVPMAPEVGLYLDECLFTSYNKRWGKSHEEISMKSYAEKADEFKRKYIWSHIADNERKEGLVGRWLHYITCQNYPDLAPLGIRSDADGVSPEADNAVASEVDTAVLLEAENVVASEMDTAVVLEAENVVPSEMDTSVVLQAENAVASEMDTAVVLEADNAVASEVDTAGVLEVDNAVASEMVTAVVLEADNSVASEVDTLVLEVDNVVASKADNTVASEMVTAVVLELDNSVASEVDAAVVLEADTPAEIVG